MTRPVSRLPSRILTALASVAVLMTMSVPVAAGPGRHIKLDLALQAWKSRSGSPDQPQRVIVHLKAGARAGFVQRMKTRGGQVRSEHPFLEDVTLDVPRRGLQSLEDDDDIESISIDAPITPHARAAPTGAVLRSTLGLVERAHRQRRRGCGDRFGHFELERVWQPHHGVLRLHRRFRPSRPAPKDPYGHGTHVAGLIAASGSPSGNLYPGVAPVPNLIGLRVLDNQGQGYTSTVIAAIEFATANRRRSAST